MTQKSLLHYKAKSCLQSMYEGENGTREVPEDAKSKALHGIHGPAEVSTLGEAAAYLAVLALNGVDPESLLSDIWLGVDLAPRCDLDALVTRIVDKHLADALSAS